MRKFINIVSENIVPADKRILPIDVADERATDIHENLGSCERIVWEKQNVIETNDLDSIGYGPNVPGVFGVHVTGDVEYWFNQLVRDYDRPALAYVIEIDCLDTDVLVEDNQIMDKTETGDSHVLLTTRDKLILGKDFRYVRTLTEADLEEEYSEEDEEY